MDNFRIYDTMFRFNNETERPSGVWRRNQKFVHDAYFWKILNMLKDEGFDVHHDEKEIHNGDIKYFRHWRDGRIYRGRVYYDLNMNWIVILNKKDTHVISCWKLFDLTPEDNLHRMKDPTQSEGYKKHS